MNTDVFSWSGPSMGGRLQVSIAADSTAAVAATRDAARVAARVNAWANRLTRFSTESDLSRLNAHAGPRTAVRPTLAAVMRWAGTAGERSSGIVDATLLEARLAAEAGLSSVRDGPEAWRMVDDGRHSVVDRRPGLRFDLDGVAKGWLADRALALLSGWPGACVDADGDIALSFTPQLYWEIEVADPRAPDAPALALLRLTPAGAWRDTLGVATSGTSVHRWRTTGSVDAHHLIDPRTGRPAVTDVIQVTVVAPTAAEAEVLAKSAVILGSAAALPHLSGRPVLGAVLLLESGEILSLPQPERSQA